MGICVCKDNKPCGIHFYRSTAITQRDNVSEKKVTRKSKKKEDKLVVKLEPCICDNCECADHSDCDCEDCECVVCEC